MIKKRLALLGVFVLCGLALTNPGKAAYENYAVERFSQMWREECNLAANHTVVATCKELAKTSKLDLKPLISAMSNRQNFYLFSLYQLNTSIPPISFQVNSDGSRIAIPTIKIQSRIESIGIGTTFFTYGTY